jgi:ubiquinone/menaquinone biosynthesis C-methylase UbiE
MDQKRQVQEQFGPSALAYVQSAGHAGGPDLDRLVGWGRARGATRVLDVATGGGHTALAFSAFTPTVIATDLTEAMLRAARGFAAERGMASILYLAADAEGLPFRDESFGIVTCRQAAHHFPAVLPMLRQVSRVLEPGGSLLLQDILGHEDAECAAFILEVEKRRDPSHVRSVPQKEWVAVLKTAGLTLIDEAVMDKVRPWDEWTDRMRMTPDAKADLERFVLSASARCREAFRVEAEGGRVRAFTDRVLLLRADKA